MELLEQMEKTKKEISGLKKIIRDNYQNSYEEIETEPEMVECD